MILMALNSIARQDSFEIAQIVFHDLFCATTKKMRAQEQSGILTKRMKL